MQLKRRCPRLGHDVDFNYCLMNGEENLPCWKVFDCWWEIFDVKSHLVAILTEAQYNRLIQKKPRDKIESILEIVEKARKRTQGKDQNEQRRATMIIKTLTVGPIMANCYILGCETTRNAVVIDPGDEADKILMALAEDKLTVKYILNTHGHFDHVGANKRLKDATGAQIVIHTEDAPMLDMVSQAAASFGLATENSPSPDMLVNDGDEITFGEITLKVIHTPGHSLGGVSFYTKDMVFVGDTLFAGSIGRTDFPGGNFETLISSVKNKLFVLGDDVKAFTGHGPATTIGHEKRTNPFLTGL